MESSSGSEWEDVDDDVDDANGRVTCLFCSEALQTPEAVFDHCTSKHDFNITDLIVKHGKASLKFSLIMVRMRLSQSFIYLCSTGLDQYSCLKMINFIRGKVPIVI